jgi:hypothetical protein
MNYVKLRYRNDKGFKETLNKAVLEYNFELHYTEWPKKMYTHCTLILMSKERIHFLGHSVYWFFLCNKTI